MFKPTKKRAAKAEKDGADTTDKGKGKAKESKGKGKEKDVGKRRAYVRVVTSLGGGSLNLELYCEKVRLVRQYRNRPIDVRIRPRKLATISSS